MNHKSRFILLIFSLAIWIVISVVWRCRRLEKHKHNWFSLLLGRHYSHFASYQIIHCDGFYMWGKIIGGIFLHVNAMVYDFNSFPRRSIMHKIKLKFMLTRSQRYHLVKHIHICFHFIRPYRGEGYSIGIH